MKRLSYETLKVIENKDYRLEDAPERILQFGEGNFLRGFVDYFIDILNEKLNFKSKVVVVQPIETGMADIINEQQGLYQLYLRGFENGRKENNRRLISCISRALDPYKDFEAFLDTARNPNMRFIVSNTTEAGIVFDKCCDFRDKPQRSFPAKLTRLLYERYTAFTDAKGYIILSCELIDNNGAELKKCVLNHAEEWKLGADFINWIKSENIFCSTLVDRIVTGYPRSESETMNMENGFADSLLDTAESFGLWVIEGSQELKRELPFENAGLPVIFTDDHTPYKQRKVRILNGAHTSMVLAAYLYGEDIVRDCMNNPVILQFIRETIFEEIIPTLTLPEEDLKSFSEAVIERFKNPFIDHRLLDISLNSVSKWKARVMPTMIDYYKKYNRLPTNIIFSFSALMAFYCSTEFREACLIGRRNGQEYPIKDSPEVLKFFADNYRRLENQQLVEKFAGSDGFFGEDLTKYPDFTKMVVRSLNEIQEKGMKRVLDESNKN